jgi:hypothetical protein
MESEHIEKGMSKFDLALIGYLGIKLAIDISVLIYIVWRLGHRG